MIQTLEPIEATATDAADLATPCFVHSVETCGTVDGPGLRYVLFLSGCPLRCQYCHNPDAQGKPCGETRLAGDVIADLKRYRNFTRSGGLTISGGEPLMQPAFVEAVLTAAKAEGIHTALDTSGFLGHKASDRLLAQTDLVLLDLKSWSPMTYKYVTGVCVDQTIKFAKRLDALDKPVWVRFVLVPGLTDAEKNVAGLAEFIASLGNVAKVEILPFHKMGEHKYREQGKAYQLYRTPEPTVGQVDEARSIFERFGVEAI